jgi:hypothetical protein
MSLSTVDISETIERTAAAENHASRNQVKGTSTDSSAAQSSSKILEGVGSY